MDARCRCPQDGSAERGTTSAAPALQSLRARYEVNLTNLAVLSPTLAGTLKVNGNLDGPINSLAAQLQMTSTLSVRGSPRETIPGEHQGARPARASERHAAGAGTLRRSAAAARCLRSSARPAIPSTSSCSARSGRARACKVT